MDEHDDDAWTGRSEGDHSAGGHQGEGHQGEGRGGNGAASGEDRSVDQTQPPPRRARQRLEHELDELRETVEELRDEFDSLRTGPDQAGGPTEGATEPPGGGLTEDSDDRTGTGPNGTPITLAELRQQLYRESAGDDDPGGDVVALLRLTSEHSAALQDLEVRKPVLPCWADMDRKQAETAWQQLVDWLCGVLIVRYPTSARTLRPCWYLHPELVENLSWLHNAWTVAFRDGNSSISMAADWHLLWLPHVMSVAGEATRKCYDAGRHDPSSDRDLTAENAVGISEDLTAHVRADLRNRPDPDDPDPRSYVVPPVRPVASPTWSSYRRDSPTPTDGPGPGKGQPYPPAPGPGPGRGTRPNPYQPR